MIPSRNKLRFNIAPGDRQVWAIGMVTVQWTLIEMWVTSYGHGLSVVIDDEKVREKFDQTRAFEIRLDQVEALAQLHLEPATWVALKALFVRVKNAKFMRDRIVHGTWGGIPHQGKYEQLATRNWVKPRQLFEWKLDYPGIMGVVKTIDGLANDFLMFMLNNAGGKKDNVTLQDALRHTLRKPDPT
jgi:hypothetical protein